MAKASTREQLRRALQQQGKTLRIEPVEMPDRPDLPQIFVRTITSKQFGVWQSTVSKIDAEGNVTNDMRDSREALLVYALCDEQGTRLFEDDELHEVGALDPDIVNACFIKASEINKISKKAKADTKNVSAPAPAGGSPTG